MHVDEEQDACRWDFGGLKWCLINISLIFLVYIFVYYMKDERLSLSLNFFVMKWAKTWI